MIRGSIFIGFCLAVAVAGSIAVAGSSYTPPPAESGGGVEGDGTGITDAAAFRGALGLGSAATSASDDFLPTGTSATGISYSPADGSDWTDPDPAEVGSGLDALAQRLTDVEGAGWQAGSAALTDWSDVGVVGAADLFPYSTGAGVWAYGTVTGAARGLFDDEDASAMRTTLGLGTAATAATGTSAGNVVVLDGSARLPAVDGSQLTGISSSPYAADVWDWTWAAGDGGTGWTLSGSAGIATVGGKSGVLSTGASNPSSALRSVGGAPTGDFELRANVYYGGTSSSTTWTYFDFQAFGRRNVFAFSSTGLAMWNAGGQLALFASGRPTAQWVTITIRVYGSSETTATVSIWLGEQFIGNMRWDGGAVSSADGSVRVGQNNGTASAISWVAYRNGINDAPPSYTYKGLGYAPDAPAP